MDLSLKTSSSVNHKPLVIRGKRPLRNLTPADKVRAIQRIRNGETKASVSRSIGVPESTIRGWCKNEEKLRCQLPTPAYEGEGIQYSHPTYAKQHSPPSTREKPINYHCNTELSPKADSQHFDQAYNSYFEKIAAFNTVMMRHAHAAENAGATKSTMAAINPNSLMFWSSASALCPEYAQLSMMQNLYLWALMFPMGTGGSEN